MGQKDRVSENPAVFLEACAARPVPPLARLEFQFHGRHPALDIRRKARRFTHRIPLGNEPFLLDLLHIDGAGQTIRRRRRTPAGSHTDDGHIVHADECAVARLARLEFKLAFGIGDASRGLSLGTWRERYHCIFHGFAVERDDASNRRHCRAAPATG